MADRRCLICEPRAFWADVFRKHWPVEGPRIVETRHWSDLARELSHASASVVCLDATGVAADEMARRLTSLQLDYPDARVILFTQNQGEVDELTWRDLGVIEVVRSPRDARPVIRLVERYCRSGEAEELTLRELLWRRIPWGHASSET